MEHNIKDSFIVSEDSYTGNIEELAQRVLKHGKITQGGKIIIDNKVLSIDQQIKLSLVIKYIAHEFDNEIPNSVRPIDLINVIHQRIEAIGSALSILKKNGFAKKESRGRYIVQIHKINNFIDEIESNQNKTTDDGKNRKSTGYKTRNKGAGSDIQMLIDNDYFEQPRLMNEVINELKKENCHHNDRVVDKTIRDTFVKSRKILKRIENKEGGKAKWQYVLRK
ncbi:hypothetical protein KKA15_02275 [Patescibacteria group bacterium]|nr:hypothetical protein [Patescibacteria group bacterium]